MTGLADKKGRWQFLSIDFEGSDGYNNSGIKSNRREESG